MICQSCTITTKTAEQVRLNPSRVKERVKTYPVDRSEFWSPLTAGPYIVPVSRWVE